MSVPNQKTIFIERSTDSVKKDFLKVSNASLNMAMSNLKPTSFMLWIYFTDNSKGYKLDLYPSNFTDLTGLSRSTYIRAFEELEEKGYLIKSKTRKNWYLFNEISDKIYPIETDEVISIDKNRFDEFKNEYF